MRTLARCRGSDFPVMEHFLSLRDTQIGVSSFGVSASLVYHHSLSSRWLSLDAVSLRLLAAADTTTLRLVNQNISAHSDAIASIEFSSDGTRLVSASHDDSIVLWGEPLHRPKRCSGCTVRTLTCGRDCCHRCVILAPADYPASRARPQDHISGLVSGWVHHRIWR